MNIKNIVTHEYPDFDCLYSIYLLRKFGGKLYSGILEATLSFVPAETLPENKSAKQLREEGTLTLDLEGGYYDHHHNEHDNQEEHSTAYLVAKDLGVLDDPALTKVLNFIDKNDLTGYGINSKEIIDHMIAIPNIIKGLNYRYSENYTKVYEICEELFEAIYINEHHWFDALESIEAGEEHFVGNFRVLVFMTESTAGAKAGRYMGGDISVMMRKEGRFSITTRRSKGWFEPNITRIAAIIRLAEAIRTKVDYNTTNLRDIGTYIDWFLHSSTAFFSRGSFKKTDVPASHLTLHELGQLVLFSIEPKEQYLGDFAEQYELFKNVLGQPLVKKKKKSNKKRR